LVRDVPNAWKPNQYDNPSNATAHYLSTGPEIWKQTEGKITHFVAGVGTGGTICGTGKYLKEQNPNIRVLGIDTYGSVFKKYKETGIFDKNEIYPYVTEGIGEDFLPQNVDFSIIDHFEKVTDKDAAIMTARITREEGIWVGNSSGSALQGLLQMKDRFGKNDVVVVIFVDHGTRYLGKMFNPSWMMKMGYVDKSGLTARDLISGSQAGVMISVDIHATVSQALQIMMEKDFSQMPVTDGGRMVGAINEHMLYQLVTKDPEIRSKKVGEVMGAAFPFVDISAPVDALAEMINAENPALLVRDFKVDKTYILTRHDIMQALLR
jgi:cystathionine beta-synthase